MQNEPDASGPTSSTSDLNTEGADLGNTLNLTSEQAHSAGIVDPQIGDEYTITIKVGDNTSGITATILDGSAVKTPENGNEEGSQIGAGEDEEEDDENPGQSEDKSMAVKTVRKPKSRVLSPADMGISTTSGL